MDIEQIRQLVADLTQAGLSGADLEKPGFRLSLKRATTLPSAARTAPTEPGAGQASASVCTVKARGVGHFLTAHPDDNVVLAPLGSAVHVGQIVGLLAVGNLLLPVRSQEAGQVSDWLVENGTTVSYGQPLLSLDHAESAEEHA